MADAQQNPVETRHPKRMLSRTGGSNVVRHGIRRQYFRDLYHFLLSTTWLGFLGLIAAAYVTINVVFAVLYLLGSDGLENARPGSFSDAFFFSVQTLATIGYGKLVPRSLYTNVLVTIEALMGLLTTAMATGLMFAKFARPTARVIFSRVAVVGLRDGVPSLMFRAANERTNQIVEATLKVVLARTERTLEGEQMRRFYDLPLVRNQNALFTLSWTAVHPIGPDSKLYGETIESLRNVDAEIIIAFMGFDESFSQTIHARFSYTADDIVWNARLADMISVDELGRRVVHYEKFDDTVPERTVSELSPGAWKGTRSVERSRG